MTRAIALRRRSISAPLVWLLALSGAAACEALTPPPATAPSAAAATPPPDYARWWEETERCSGLSGDFRTIEWYVIPRVSTFATQHGERVGLWSASSTGASVVLAENFADNELVVRHEMLHALLGQRGHPTEYFARRCHLTWESWPDRTPPQEQLATRN